MEMPTVLEGEKEEEEEEEEEEEAVEVGEGRHGNGSPAILIDPRLCPVRWHFHLLTLLASKPPHQCPFFFSLSLSLSFGFKQKKITSNDKHRTKKKNRRSCQRVDEQKKLVKMRERFITNKKALGRKK